MTSFALMLTVVFPTLTIIVAILCLWYMALAE